MPQISYSPCCSPVTKPSADQEQRHNHVLDVVEVDIQRKAYGACILNEYQVIFRQAFIRSEEHTSELQSRGHLVCRLLLEKKTVNSIDGWVVYLQVHLIAH